MKLFRQLPNLILPQRFASITSLELAWQMQYEDEPTSALGSKERYVQLWEVIASMPNLRKLKFAAKCGSTYKRIPINGGEDWLGPLDKLAELKLQIFDFVVPSYYFFDLIKMRKSPVYQLVDSHDAIDQPGGGLSG